jgi:phytol kinase
MQLPIWQPFINEWYTFVLFFIFIFILIGISEVARSMLQWSPLSSRKLVHLIVGTLVSACPFIFKSNIPPVFLAGVFIFVNALALKTEKFKGMHSTDRASYGTVYFPIAFLILALFWWDKPITLILSIMIMTYSDTIAAVTGELVHRPRKFQVWDDTKSVEGCLGMFLSSFMIIYIGTDLFAWLFGAAFFVPLTVLIGVSGFVAMSVTLSELISSRGSDNFSVPIIAALSYDMFLIN